MPKRKATAGIIKLLHRLAGSPEHVQVTETGQYDMMGWGLTKHDVCEALREWIEGAGDVEEVITKYARGQVGKPAYVIKPEFGGLKFYVKLGIRKYPTGEEELLIISSHPQH
jgi:hypothetical protein